MLSFNSFRKSQPARIGVVIGFALLLMVAAAMKEPRRGQAASSQRQSLTFEERVAAQRAIEEVYWRHRIWPKENPRPKPALDEVMPEEALRARVEDYLGMSSALEVYWQRPITGEQLQAEMERMARQTKQPEVLRELWAALGNDPFIIAECLARPLLVERLSRSLYASDDRFHGELKRRAEAELSQPNAAAQMRQMSGEYHEVEWRKGDGSIGATAARRPAVGEAQVLDEEQWREQISKLAQMFSAVQREAIGSITQRELINPQSAIRNSQLQALPMGRLSGLREDETRFYVMAVVEKGADRLKVASVDWRKESFAEWWSGVREQMERATAASEEYRLPEIEAVSAQYESESSALTGADVPSRSSHTAVWTGNEMIVWGGFVGGVTNTGGRYNTATDTWVATNTTGAPSARGLHNAVWTGIEMIVWGGYDGNSEINTGGRYNPITNTWTVTNTTGASSARYQHTAVWTGSEMIIWGGTASDSNTGGHYNPVTDTWIATSTTNAPTARNYHTAVWTGSEMIIWGGQPGGGYINTGARYNPTTKTWIATNITGAPSARVIHSAVWTGNEMIIWGGSSGDYTNTGGRYNPATDTWMATSTINAPDARWDHHAVWTGGEMIVWGGSNGNPTHTGGRYNPVSNTWTATNITNAPSVRQRHTAVWTGNEMIVWGGFGDSSLNTGGRYNPATDSWMATNITTLAPSVRFAHTAVWTGSEMIIWGGVGDSLFNSGGRYNPATDTWVATSTTLAPNPRSSHTAVWTGSEMIIWGGNFSGMNTGGRYNPATDTWTTTSTINAPSARNQHTAVWTGSEMIVWGGYGGSYLNTGGRYNPANNTWTATNTINTPIARSAYTAVWTGNEMIVWGGYGSTYTNTGGRYNPATDIWTATNTTLAPNARDKHIAVWTGSEMIIWGGFGSNVSNTGGRYNPANDIWTATSMAFAPDARGSHTVIWTGSEMIVWGGYYGNGNNTNTGGQYNPATNTWKTTSTTLAPSPRHAHTAVWTGSRMIVWGGLSSGRFVSINDVNPINTSGIYNPAADSWTATNTCTYSIAPANQAFAGNGGAGSVSVTTASGCNWTASSNANWITITSGSSGAGNGTVNYSVAANANPSPRTGTITFAGQTFTVTQSGANPLPVIASLSPNSAIAGGAAFTLTVNGMDFVNGAIVRWNGSDRATTFVNGTQLAAAITGADIATAGTANVTVFNQTPGGGVSNALNFTIILQGYEADVTPRPNGSNNGTITVSDWVQVGRFAAGLDTAANGSEFQRADCAPRSTFGDGQLTASDWVQAGRYASGEDPIVVASGPTSPIPSSTASAQMVAARAVKPNEPRLLRVITGDDSSGAARTMMVELDAQGDENALGFSLRFNPSQWRFVSAEAGLDARRAVIHVNAREVARGHLGFILALPAGGKFRAGTHWIVTLKFASIFGAGAKPLAIGLADEPVAREIVDREAAVLPARYEIKSIPQEIGAVVNAPVSQTVTWMSRSSGTAGRRISRASASGSRSLEKNRAVRRTAACNASRLPHAIFQSRSARLRRPMCGSGFALPDAAGLFRATPPRFGITEKCQWIRERRTPRDVRGRLPALADRAHRGVC